MIESISTHFPYARVTVFDENSDDPATKEYLDRCGVEVYQPAANAVSRHRNLYANRQTALERCTTDYLLFVQDNMQFVRSLREEDLAVIEKAFADVDRAFLRPELFKPQDGDRTVNSTTIDAPQGVIVPKASFDVAMPGNAYCDVMICDVKKLRERAWDFQNN